MYVISGKRSINASDSSPISSLCVLLSLPSMLRRWTECMAAQAFLSIWYGGRGEGGREGESHITVNVLLQSLPLNPPQSKNRFPTPALTCHPILSVYTHTTLHGLRYIYLYTYLPSGQCKHHPCKTGHVELQMNSYQLLSLWGF